MSMTKTRSEVAALVREARLKLDLKLDWVAFELGYANYNIICDIENDRRIIPINRVPDFARVLQIPLGDLAQAVVMARYTQGSIA